MSQDFKLKFDDYKNNDPTGKQDGENNSDQYPSFGNARHVVFIWSENRMQSFNYSYLVTQSYDASKNTILMQFSSHTIEIKGVRLDGLFHELVAQIPKYIRVTDKRYNDTEDKNGSIINEVVVTEK